MRFFYSASTMGYGWGRKWHGVFDFPLFQRVTKTITTEYKIGLPCAVIPVKDSVWNCVKLHNIGFDYWLNDYYAKDPVFTEHYIIVSIAGTDDEINNMVSILESCTLQGIELNFSCPNVKSHKNKKIPKSKHPIYLKLSHDQDPYQYELDRIKGIRLNSVKWLWGSLSGAAAKEKNWAFIARHAQNLNVAGCSMTDSDDIKELQDMGCTEIGLGAIILIDPGFVEGLS